MRAITVLLIAASLAAGGCATSGKRMSDKQQREQFMQYAGAPVQGFTYLGRYDSWQALGDNDLVVWTSINNAYLLTLRPPCTGLVFADRIGLTSSNRTVSARFDSVRFQGEQNCFIQEIRPIDYRKMQADRRAHRQKSEQPAT